MALFLRLSHAFIRANHFTPVLEYAVADDSSSGATLCRVCRMFRTWVLPELYGRVVLATSDRVVRFAHSLMESQYDVPLEPTPASAVLALWIGPCSFDSHHNLTYGSSTWPITLIQQTLARLPALKTLAIINLSQFLLRHITSVIPRTVSTLYLGPVHGTIDIRHLPCATSLHLRTLTSLDTWMDDTEICALVRAPGVRVVRRLFSSGAHVKLAFEQLACVDARAPALERMEIVCYGTTRADAARVLDGMAERYEFDRERVVLVPRAAQVLERNGAVDSALALFRDWLEHEDGVLA